MSIRIRSGLQLLSITLAMPPFITGQQKAVALEDTRATVVRHVDMTYTMPGYKTKEEWLARSESLRMQILVASGLWPMPEKTPLNPHVFDRLERNGYSIEKVYFESYPGFYVTGNLYRPLGKNGPFPGVLSPHGHWAYGRLQNSESASVPARSITLARQGYVVFAYDMVGYNDSRQVNHRFMGEREALWGFGSLGLHLWNSIRSVDFLETLPDVDKTRIACTGASGGGTQTFLLSAVDKRIAVSAPVNMISAHMQGGDVCENAPNLRIDTNNMEIGALAAPRPMIMVSATGDWTKNTLQVEFPAIQSIYRLLGAEDKISAVQEQADHNYNKPSREHVYRWFGRWMLGLSDTGALVEKNVPVEFPSDLLVFYGRPLPPEAKTERQIVEQFIQNAAASIDRLKLSDPASLQRYRDAFEPALRYSLMAEFPPSGSVETLQPESKDGSGHRVRRFYLRRSNKGDHVPATQWLPSGKQAVRQAVLLIHPKGSERFEQNGAPGELVKSLLKEECSVLIPDVFNTGRASLGKRETKRFFTAYNRTDDANRVQDILTGLAYLRREAPQIPLKVVGFERAGLWCLMARALTVEEVAFCVDADQFDAGSDQAYLQGFNIPGIRRAGDFRTAAVLNMRGPLWIQNASASFPSDWIQSAYRSLAKSDLLRIEARRASEKEILDWILPRSPRSN